MKKIVLCGGGSAGHVYPALAVAEKLKNYKIYFFGGSGIEKDILKKFKNIEYVEIPTVKFQRSLTPKNLLIPFKLLRSVRFCKQKLQQIAPDIIFSKGGFVSVPVAMAGARLGIPIISHESDLSFGLANRLILHCCTVMCTTFEQTGARNKKCVCTGQPLREQIFHGKPLREEIFQGRPLRQNFNPSHPTVLVLGGSLGAKFLNDLVFENLDALTEKYNILHVCGKKNYQNVVHENYYLAPFAENISDLYATANIVVSRAGSGVINELLALEKPMLLIPLSKKASRGDQIENAKVFVEKGYAEMLKEEDCTFEKFMQKLEKTQKNAQILQKNMKKSAKNRATEQIFNLIEKYSNKK